MMGKQFKRYVFFSHLTLLEMSLSTDSARKLNSEIKFPGGRPKSRTGVVYYSLFRSSLFQTKLSLSFTPFLFWSTAEFVSDEFVDSCVCRHNEVVPKEMNQYLLSLSTADNETYQAWC
jgi:hypothetical protein